MPHILVSGWKPGFQKVPFTKLLQETAELELPEAKRITDLVLSGQCVELDMPTEAIVTSFRSRASDLGAVVGERLAASPRWRPPDGSGPECREQL